MSPIECGFCRHDNPPNSRFCNACGAPLAVAPCPQCGAVNDGTATTCQKCDAPIAESPPDDFFLPLPPEAPTSPRSALQATETTTEPAPARRDTREGEEPPAVPAANATPGTFHDVAPPLADNPSTESFVPSAPAAPASPSSSLLPTDTVAEPEPARRDTPDVEAPPPTAPAVNAASGTFDNGVATGPRRGVSKARAALVVVALAVSVYFAYGYFQHFQPSDVVRPASTGEAKDSTSPPASGKLKSAPAAATPIMAPDPVVGASSPPAAPATERAAPAASQAKAATATSTATGVAQRPPGSGPCTDALAALGLCTQENSQGRKP